MNSINVVQDAEDDSEKILFDAFDQSLSTATMQNLSKCSPVKFKKPVQASEKKKNLKATGPNSKVYKKKVRNKRSLNHYDLRPLVLAGKRKAKLT
mmetsp:Transcript_9437/g.10587  ORF Transcript_9437/g.10587 Transcript_9437/m.10587 type:complete len:95 (+) Transcript_9437:697-981(+)